MKQAKLYHHDRLLMPHRTVGIWPPKSFKDTYDYLLIHEYYCAGCILTGVNPYKLAWEGVDYKGKHTSLKQISNDDFPKWSTWMVSQQMFENSKGATRVDGSIKDRASGKYYYSKGIPVR